MTPSKQLTQEQIKQAVISAFADIAPAMCQIEKARMDRLEEAVAQLAVIISGNSHPKEGLAYKANTNQTDIEELREIAKTRSSREWAMVLIMLGLLATSIWNLFAV